MVRPTLIHFPLSLKPFLAANPASLAADGQCLILAVAGAVQGLRVWGQNQKQQMANHF
jgi:hypothetical protein